MITSASLPDMDICSVPELGHPAQSLPVVIADFSGGTDLIIRDLIAAPLLQLILEQGDDEFIPGLVQAVAGKQPVDKGDRGDGLIRLHPFQLPQIQVDADDDVRAVGNCQEIGKLLIGSVHQPFKLGTNHRLKGVLQIGVRLNQRLGRIGIDLDGQHPGSHYQLVGDIKAHLAKHLFSCGAPGLCSGIAVVINCFQSGKGRALQSTRTNAQ